MPGPLFWLRALGNVRDRVLEGPLADLRRMPRTAIDHGPESGDPTGDEGDWGLGRAHGLVRAGSVSTYRYAVHPSARLRGAPVLLVSPLGACGVAFDLRRGCSLVEHLVGEGRHVHQVDDEDVIGHGADHPGPADLQRWVDDVLPHVIRTVSEHHGGAPVHVVGWSIGGLLSVLSAAAHPDLPIRSIVAIATPFSLGLVPPVAPSRPLASAAGGPVLATAQALLDLLPVPRMLRSIGLGHLDELLTAPLTVLARLDDRDFLAQLEAVDALRALVGTHQQLIGCYLREMVDADALATGRVAVGARAVDLSDLQRPVLLLAGEDDVVAPPRSVRAGAAVLTGAEVAVTTGPGGHLGVLCGRAARQRTWPQICGFLDRHDPAVPVAGSTRRRRARPPAADRGSPDAPVGGSAPGSDEPSSTRRRSPTPRRRGRPAPRPATRTRRSD